MYVSIMTNALTDLEQQACKHMIDNHIEQLIFDEPIEESIQTTGLTISIIGLIEHAGSPTGDLISLWIEKKYPTGKTTKDMIPFRDYPLWKDLDLLSNRINAETYTVKVKAQ